MIVSDKAPVVAVRLAKWVNQVHGRNGGENALIEKGVYYWPTKKKDSVVAGIELLKAIRAKIEGLPGGEEALKAAGF